MPITSAKTFIARGTISRNGASVPATIYGTIPQIGLEPVECTVVLERQEWPPEFGSLMDYHDTELRAKTESGTEIWIPDFTITTTNSAPHEQDHWAGIRCKGIAQVFIEGDFAEFDASVGQVSCSVVVLPTALTFKPEMRFLHSNGSIEVMRPTEEELKEIRWITRLGEAGFMDRYETVEDTFALEPALVRRKRCKITLSPLYSGSTSLRTLYADLKEILDEPLLLISFLSRKHVAWYEAKAQFFSHEVKPPILHEVAIRSQEGLGIDPAKQTPTSFFNLPVHQEALQNGLFEQLLEQYRASPLKPTIRQTIAHLNATYSAGYMEAKLGLIYSALEGLVDGISKYLDEANDQEKEENKNVKLQYLLGAGPFKKLAHAVRQTIRETVQDTETVEAIIRKIAELQRRDFHSRLELLLKHFRLEYVLLAKSGAFFIAHIPDMIQRRNRFIHQGQFTEEHWEDYHVWRELIELWILRLLDCPEEAINRTAFRNASLPQGVWHDQ